MPGPQDRKPVRHRAERTLRLAVTAMFAWTAVVYPALAQAPSPDIQPGAAPGQAPQSPTYAMSDLEYLLGPIALYPDPLLALILPASTFPIQIVQADRWIASNPEAVEKGDFTQVDAKPWDPTVQALARFPDVIRTMADHLDWLESLGNAYYFQPQDVAAAIQLLRAKAVDVGNLKTTQQQVVTSRDEGGSRIIYIAPANPERIYVPVYDPALVFTGFATGALIFTTGVLVGSAWNNRWGWNNKIWNQVWITPPAPRPGRPGPPPGGWRPDRPGTRPDRPGTRPDRPGRPDRPDRPDRPGSRPDRPSARPDRPAVSPDRPVRPDRPAARPDRPAARPDRPAAPRPERPAARPSRPSAPAARPGGNRPGHVQKRPAARPQQGARPQPSARPQPAARPSQPRARPHQGARPAQKRARPQGAGSRRQ